MNAYVEMLQDRFGEGRDNLAGERVFIPPGLAFVWLGLGVCKPVDHEEARLAGVAAAGAASFAAAQDAKVQSDEAQAALEQAQAAAQAFATAGDPAIAEDAPPMEAHEDIPSQSFQEPDVEVAVKTVSRRAR